MKMFSALIMLFLISFPTVLAQAEMRTYISSSDLANIVEQNAESYRNSIRDASSSRSLWARQLRAQRTTEARERKAAAYSRQGTLSPTAKARRARVAKQREATKYVPFSSFDLASGEVLRPERQRFATSRERAEFERENYIRKSRALLGTVESRRAFLSRRTASY